MFRVYIHYSKEKCIRFKWDQYHNYHKSFSKFKDEQQIIQRNFSDGFWQKAFHRKWIKLNITRTLKRELGQTCFEVYVPRRPWRKEYDVFHTLSFFVKLCLCPFSVLVVIKRDTAFRINEETVVSFTSASVIW